VWIAPVLNAGLHPMIRRTQNSENQRSKILNSKSWSHNPDPKILASCITCTRRGFAGIVSDPGKSPPAGQDNTQSTFPFLLFAPLFFEGEADGSQLPLRGNAAGSKSPVKRPAVRSGVLFEQSRTA
jgi:hypothetical protein